MTAFLDTNIVVRHLTGDPPEMAARATAYLQSETGLFLTDPVLKANGVKARVDFAEAYLVASAESTGIGRIASFDRSLDRVHSVERIEPPTL